MYEAPNYILYKDNIENTVLNRYELLKNKIDFTKLNDWTCLDPYGSKYGVDCAINSLAFFFDVNHKYNGLIEEAKKLNQEMKGLGYKKYIEKIYDLNNKQNHILIYYPIEDGIDYVMKNLNENESTLFSIDKSMMGHTVIFAFSNNKTPLLIDPQQNYIYSGIEHIKKCLINMNATGVFLVFRSKKKSHPLIETGIGIRKEKEQQDKKKIKIGISIPRSTNKKSIKKRSMKKMMMKRTMKKTMKKSMKKSMKK